MAPAGKKAVPPLFHATANNGKDREKNKQIMSVRERCTPNTYTSSSRDLHDEAVIGGKPSTDRSAA